MASSSSAREDTLRESKDPDEPRVTLTVSHAGEVRISTCDQCTGTPDDLKEVLETVLSHYPWDEGRVF